MRFFKYVILKDINNVNKIFKKWEKVAPFNRYGGALYSPLWSRRRAHIMSLSRSLSYQRRCVAYMCPRVLSLRYLAFVRRIHSSSKPDCSKSKTSTMSSVERDQLGQRGSGDSFCAGLLRGLDHIRDPQLNKVRIINAIVCYSRRKIIALRDVYCSHINCHTSGQRSRFNWGLN